jgi:hypothetical protein
MRMGLIYLTPHALAVAVDLIWDAREAAAFATPTVVGAKVSQPLFCSPDQRRPENQQEKPSNHASGVYFVQSLLPPSRLAGQVHLCELPCALPGNLLVDLCGNYPLLLAVKCLPHILAVY